MRVAAVRALSRWEPTYPRIGVGVALAAAALVFTACSRPSAARLNADGNHAYARGDYPTALESYRKAQVERPDLAALNYNAGNVLHQQGDYQRAISESQRATTGGDVDTRVRAFYSIGSDYYRQGKLKESLEAFKNALRLDPSDVDAKYNVEVIQRQLDQQAQQRKTQPNQQNDPQQSQGNQQPQRGQQPQQPQQQQGQQQGQQNQQPQGQQGQQQGQQPGQPQQGQQGQPGAGQQQGGAQQPSGQQDPNGQQGQQNAGQPAGGQQGGAPATSSQPGSTGSPSTRQQQAALSQDLRNAIDAYQKQPTIEEALRILDILAEQQRLNQAAQGNRSDPRTLDK